MKERQEKFTEDSKQVRMQKKKDRNLFKTESWKDHMQEIENKRWHAGDRRREEKSKNEGCHASRRKEKGRNEGCHAADSRREEKARIKARSHQDPNDIVQPVVVVTVDM